jgi:protein-disulfide isomerase
MHKNAPAAHAASEAAHRQGKFWEMHDLIFENQRNLDADTFFGYAKQLGLDEARFKADFVALEVKKRVDADAKEAASLGVTGTPGFFVNGRFLRGAKPFAEFKKVIDEELAKG